MTETKWELNTQTDQPNPPPIREDFATLQQSARSCTCSNSFAGFGLFFSSGCLFYRLVWGRAYRKILEEQLPECCSDVLLEVPSLTGRFSNSSRSDLGFVVRAWKGVLSIRSRPFRKDAQVCSSTDALREKDTWQTDPEIFALIAIPQITTATCWNRLPQQHTKQRKVTVSAGAA